MIGAQIRAVTFDYWNTIVRADADQAGRRRQAWVEEYDRAGATVAEDTVRDVFRVVWERHQAAWIRNEQFTGEQAARAAIDLIGIPVEDAMRERLVERFVTAGAEAGFHLCDGVDDVVAALAERGVRLGIVCDVGFTPSTGLRTMLDDFGLLGHFVGCSFSDDVGWYKPAPQIFEHALAYLGVAPEHAAHVGDLRRSDVAGARSMGMVSVRYRGAHDDAGEGPEADHVVDHHAALWDALAL